MHRFLWVLGVLLFSACDKPDLAQHRAMDSGQFLEKEFLFGKIGIGMSNQDVVAILGPPVETVPQPHRCVGNEVCEDWIYPNAWIDMKRGTVFGMSSSSPDLCLSDNVCPMDSTESVYEKLGKTEIFPASSDKPVGLSYLSPTHETCWLWVFLETDQTRISELRLACQP